MADRENIRREREMESSLKVIFDAMLLNVSRKLLSGNRNKSEFEIDMILSEMTGAKFMKQYVDVISKTSIEAAQYGANRNVYQIRKAGGKAEYKSISARTRDIIESSIFEASNNTMNRLKGDVKSVLLEAYDEGKGTSQIAADLRSQFDYMETFELKRIARTEVNSFHNEGNYIAKQESGVQYHMWVTSGDERVRSAHKSIDGEIVKVGDLFSNGLRYPGDRSGDIGQWINCRCIARAYFIPSGYAVPVGVTNFTEKDLIKI